MASSSYRNMKIQELHKAVASAQQEFSAAERKAVVARLGAKAAKATAEKSRLQHRRARKASKHAKKLAVEAESLAQDLAGILAKAQKRLAKALKKMGPVKVVRKAKSIRLSRKLVPSAAGKVAAPKAAVARKATLPAAPARPATDGHLMPPVLPGSASKPADPSV